MQTEIAAIEAARNEAEVRAEGALVGERRAAVARLAMIAMFGLVSGLRAGPRNLAQTAVGAGFTVVAFVLLVGLYRTRTNPFKARWIPLVTTTLDFGAVTTLAMLDVWWTGAYNPGQHVIASTILLTFALARVSVWHVIYSLACAEISLLVVSAYAGVTDIHPIVFISGGYLVLGLLLGLTNRAVGRMFQDLRRRDNLTRFLPRQVAERVMRAGPNALAPVEREVTVLFSDIRGFTGMSEGLEPREVLSMLDDYFGRMSQVVKGHDGVVGKFIGDGMLAFWGVPDKLADHAVLAVKAARDMRAAVRELNHHRETEGKPPIKIGIGVHTGNVAAGMLGGALQAEYTVIGDAVNVASRIEGLTKDHAVDLLVSEMTWSKLGAGAKGRRVADAAIRGRKEPVVLYTFDEEPYE